QLLPEEALHPLEIEGAAVARVQSLRRPQGKPVIADKDFIVSLRGLFREDVPFVENLKRNGRDIFTDRDMHVAAVNTPAALVFVWRGLQRAGAKRCDHDIFLCSNRRAEMEYVINFVRWSLQPAILALYTVKHNPYSDLRRSAPLLRR